FETDFGYDFEFLDVLAFSELFIDEQTSPISLQESDEFNQEDSAEFDGDTQFVPYDSLNHMRKFSHLQRISNHQMCRISIKYNPRLTFGQRRQFIEPVTHDQEDSPFIGDPSKPVMTRQRLHTDSEVCMYALTVSTFEPKNNKEAMADHSLL
ncbi:hypothetical protein Tco_0224332, partial [Tanacetum coccineum]